MFKHADNKVAAAIHDLQNNLKKSDRTRLTSDEEFGLHTPIEDSITARYDGDLERYDDPQDGGFVYLPLDTDHIRELLTTLWSEHITAETLDQVFETLTR